MSPKKEDPTISIIGVRGLGVIYSGFETFVYKLTEKVRRDTRFKIYARKAYQKQNYSKMNVKVIPIYTVQGKHLETFFYSMVSNIHSYFSKANAVLYLGVVNGSFFIPIHKLLGRKVIVNVDGIDWQRSRWSNLGKFYIKACEKLCVLFADYLICDSKTVMKYYKNKYHTDKTIYIPYGSEVKIRKPGETLKRFSLLPRKYFLFVGRLVPENSVEDLILAFKGVKTLDYKCVVVGDSTYEDKYKKYLIDLIKNDKRFVFTGFLTGRDYEEICSNAFAYIETKSVGGTHPSLLEAMGFGNCIVAKNIGFHKEVIQNAGLYYSNTNRVKDLRKKLEYLLSNPQKVRELRKSALKQSNNFLWERVVNQYQELFSSLK